MIQRVQSLYLVLSSVIQVLFATGVYFTVTSANEILKFTGSGVFNNEEIKIDGNMKTLILGLAIAALSFVAIFLFKNRKLQIKLARVSGLLTLAEILFIVMTYINASGIEGATISIGYPVFILPISTILLFLAAAAIKKDDDLVRSVDRIR